MDSFLVLSNVFLQGSEDKVDGAKLITWDSKRLQTGREAPRVTKKLPELLRGV